MLGRYSYSYCFNYNRGEQMNSVEFETQSTPVCAWTFSFFNRADD